VQLCMQEYVQAVSLTSSVRGRMPRELCRVLAKMSHKAAAYARADVDLQLHCFQLPCLAKAQRQDDDVACHTAAAAGTLQLPSESA
jgi:hypothetical protein